MYHSRLHRKTFGPATLTRLLAVVVVLASLLSALPVAGAGVTSEVKSTLGSPASAAPAQAGTTCVVLQPAAQAGTDAYIKQEKVDERRGGDSELRIKSENGKLMRSLLQFSMPSLPVGSTIDSATLSLYVKDSSGGAVTINAHQVTAAWNEAEVTWKARDKAANQLWTNLGGDYNPAVVSSAVVDNTKNVWRSWNLTSLVGAWIANPATNYGVILEAPAGIKAEKKFKSSDDGTAAQRPKLEICYSSGVAIEPDNQGEGVAGFIKTYSHIVTVEGITTAVNLSATSSNNWTTQILKDVNGNGMPDPEDTPITQTPVLGPAAVTYPILVQVFIPLSAHQGQQDSTTVTAAAQSNPLLKETATDVTVLGQLIAVIPNHSQYAVAGQVIDYEHDIINNGDSQDCVTLSASSSQNWNVQLYEDSNNDGFHLAGEPAVSNPVCINPGEAYYIVAQVTVPGGAAAGLIDQTVISAESGIEPSKVGVATIGPRSSSTTRRSSTANTTTSTPFPPTQLKSATP